MGFVVIPATRRRLNSSAAAAVLFKRLACWGDATWLASNRERLFISLLLPSLRGLLPDAPSACPSECGAPPSSSATPSSDSGSLHLIQAQSFSRFLCRPSQLLGPPMCHTWVSRFSMKRETDAFASGEGGNSVKQSPIMVKLTNSPETCRLQWLRGRIWDRWRPSWRDLWRACSFRGLHRADVRVFPDIQPSVPSECGCG